MNDTIKIEIEFSKADLLALGKFIKKPLASREDVRHFVKEITRRTFNEMRNRQRAEGQGGGK